MKRFIALSLLLFCLFGMADYFTSPGVTQSGSATSAAIAPAGDPNTGMFFPAADTIGFTTGGTNALQVNPDRSFTHNGASGQQPYLFTRLGVSLAIQSQTSGTTSDIATFSKDGDGTDYVRNIIFGKGLPSDVTNSEALEEFWDPFNLRFRIQTTNSGTGIARPLELIAGSNFGQILLNTNGTITLGTGALLGTNGTAALPGYSFSGDTNTGIYRSAADELSVSTGGVQSFKFNPDQSFTHLGASGQQAYLFTRQGTRLAVQSQTSASDFGLELYSKDGDGSKTTAIRLLSKGTPTNVANAEFLQITWDPSTFGSDRFVINTSKTGSGTIQSLSLQTSTNHGQLLLNTNGSVNIGMTGETDIHRINTTVQTPSVGVLTLTNGPGASTGNPAVYLTLNINGTNYAIPAWAF